MCGSNDRAFLAVDCKLAGWGPVAQAKLFQFILGWLAIVSLLPELLSTCASMVRIIGVTVIRSRKEWL